MLKWLRAEGCPWNGQACSHAARGGHLRVLKWLRAEGCPCNKMASAVAAQYGHLGVLKWLRAEGCPWHEDTVGYAASSENLKVLKWLRAKGYPWGKLAIASRMKAPDVEVYVVIGQAISADDAVSEPAKRASDMKMLKWLLNNGCPRAPWSATDEEWVRKLNSNK